METTNEITQRYYGDKAAPDTLKEYSVHFGHDHGFSEARIEAASLQDAMAKAKEYECDNVDFVQHYDVEYNVDFIRVTDDDTDEELEHDFILEREFSLQENIAAISAELHTHALYWPFYEQQGRYIDGFVGNFRLAINMAKALTLWEDLHGGHGEAYDKNGLIWLELVQTYTDHMLRATLAQDSIEDEHKGLEQALLKFENPNKED